MSESFPKHRSLRRVAVLALAVCAGAAQAQPQALQPPPTARADAALPAVALTLEQLTHTVLQYNPGLLSTQQARATAAAAVTSAGALPNPSLEYSGGRQSARIAGGNAGSLQTWGVSQLIESPSLRRARLDAARSFEDNSVQQVAVQRNALAAEVRLRAYEYLLRLAEAEAAADALGLLEQVQSRVQARVASGEGPRYELIKAESEVINARQVRDSAVLLAEQTAIALNRLAAGRLPARWTLDATLAGDDQPVPDTAALEREAQERNPELLALRTEVERARAQTALARAGRWPGVTLRYSHSREPDVKQNTLGVGVQIPLFDRNAGPIAEASSELVRAEGRLDGRRAELQQQILQSARLLDMARLKAQALSQGSVRDAEATLRVAEAAYRYGERGILDVLDAQRVLRAIRADLLVARYQVQAARTELDLLAGRYAGTTAPAVPNQP